LTGHFVRGHPAAGGLRVLLDGLDAQLHWSLIAIQLVMYRRVWDGSSGTSPVGRVLVGLLQVGGLADRLQMGFVVQVVCVGNAAFLAPGRGARLAEIVIPTVL
jgi:hypothetical protein